MYETAAKFSAPVAKVFINAYQQSQDVPLDTFTEAFNTAYKLGYDSGNTNTYAATAREFVGHVLNNAQINSAYQAGQFQRRVDTQNRQRTINEAVKKSEAKSEGKKKTSEIGSGKTRIDMSEIEGKHLGVRQRHEIEVIKSLSEVLGANIKVTASETGIDPKTGKEVYTGKNGSYTPSTNTFTIDITAGLYELADNPEFKGSMLRSFSHELTHFIQNWSPEEYETIKNHVLSTLDMRGKGTAAGRARVRQIQAAEQKVYIDRSASVDEVLANACETMLRDSEALSEFATELAQQDMTLAQRIKNWITEYISKIKAVLDKITASSIEARILEDYSDDLAEIQKIWDEALKNAIRTSNATGGVVNTDGGVQNSLKNIPSDIEIEENIKLVSEMESVCDLIGNEFPKGKIDLVTQVSDYFDSIGNKVVSSYGDTILLEKEGVRSSLGHKMGRKKAIAFKAVPDVISKGKMIDYEVNWKGRNYDTVVYAALIKIANEDFYMGVIANVNKISNNYYLHEVLLQKKENDTAFKNGSVPKGSPIAASNSLFSLLQKINNVKQKSIRDAEYFKAVEANDMNTAQKLVDEAAKTAGYTARMWHGSKKGGGFTQFRDWTYFTENKAYAERYAERDNAASLYESYIKLQKPFDTRNTEARNIFENDIRPEYGTGDIQDTGLPDWTDGYDISDYIDENELDYDGIVLDEGGDMVNGKPVSRGLSYVVRKSAQIKSAEAVTYDDNGNVIPLSERFNRNNEDIRYSLRDTYDDTQTLTKDLKKELKSSLTVTELDSYMKYLVDIAADIESSEDYEAFRDTVRSYAEAFVESSNTTEKIDSEERKAMSDYFRGKHFRITPELKAEVASQYGSYRSFHAQMFGKGIYFSEDADFTLDDYWGEICAEFPNVFDETTSDKDQPQAILDAFDGMKAVQASISESEKQERAEWLTDKLTDYISQIRKAESAVHIKNKALRRSK